MNKKILALAITGLFANTTAMADGKSWEGFKIGIGGGGVSSTAKTTNRASHDFSENSSYQTNSNSVNDNATSDFTANNKFNPAYNGTQNSRLIGDQNGVLHTYTGTGGGTAINDNNSVQDQTGSLDNNPDGGTGGGAGFTSGYNYYDRDYRISEGFVGSALDTINQGKAGGFATLDFGYDWQLSDSFVLGLTASANLSSNRKAKGAASGGNSAGWTEDLSYNYIYNSTGSECYDVNNCGSGTGTGGGTYTTYSSSPNNLVTGAGAGALSQESTTSMSSSFSTGNSFDIGARMGLLANESTLIYLSGGFSTMKVKQKTTYTSSSAVGSKDSVYGDDISSDNYYYFSDTKSSSTYKPGYFLGAGMETKLSDNVSMKLEYRYANYGTVKSSRTNNDAQIVDGTNDNSFEFYNTLGGSYNMSQKTDLTTQSIRAVLSYGF